jgi:hypothetical protein
MVPEDAEQDRRDDHLEEDVGEGGRGHPDEGTVVRTTPTSAAVET